MIWASDILPGPTIIITSTDASKIKSNSTPPFPMILDAPFTMKIAPSMIIEINDADNPDVFYCGQKTEKIYCAHSSCCVKFVYMDRGIRPSAG